MSSTRKFESFVADNAGFYDSGRHKSTRFLFCCHTNKFCNSKKKNGRFTGIDASRFKTNKGVTDALDNLTGDTIILKSFTIVEEDHLQTAKEEAATLSQLAHKNIVRYVDFIDELTPAWNKRCSMCFIAMQRCAGGSLVDWIDRMNEGWRRTSGAEAAVIGAQLVSALSYCHQRGIGHFDMKPGNVFIMADFIEVKLGDFGSALTIQSASESIKAGSSLYTTKGVFAHTPLYAPPEFHTDEKVKKSPRLDVWGFAMILQEVLTLEHAFGRVDDQEANHPQIQLNIRQHEKKESKRTCIYKIVDETDEFDRFEDLLEKCLRGNRKKRPRTAIELRNEGVLVDFLNKLENGARPCELVPPPFEDEKEMQIREMRAKLATKDRTITDLEKTVNSAMNAKHEIGQRDEIIEMKNEEILELKTEIENWKVNFAKMREANSKLESDLREYKKIIEQLTMEQDLERENWKNEMAKMRRLTLKLESEFEEAKKINEQVKAVKTQNRELKEELTKKDGKIAYLENSSRQTEEREKLRIEMGEIAGAGHFWGNDKHTSNGGVRNEMEEEELKKVLKLLALGEKKINLKFYYSDNWEVAEAGWTIQFKSTVDDFREDGEYFYLWISNKEGGAKFKATVEEIDHLTGEEENHRELHSEKDGTRQRIKYEEEFDADYFVRFNITLL
ncbi:unnamed protein product [Oikopleura dioica]|uniref:Protein kinase domain-containing protein n=1 Tax=Oikopleura dioica TaxID=34765 RepID=E4Y7B5_OIKDI|nr:unnamed protein product [Oikopleura dioica]